MDGVSAAASVVAIVQCAAKAIRAIDWLSDFCDAFATDNKDELVRDLSAVASTLTDVTSTCEQIQASKVSASGYRFNALAIQVEDCAADLDKWLVAGQRLQFKHDTRVSKNLIVQTGKRFWNTFIKRALKESRQNIYARLQWHQRNIEMSLSIFGRTIDITNAKELQAVKQVTEAVQQKLCVEVDLMITQLDGLSKSSSSILASSRSTDERLRDVEAVSSVLSADVQDIKELLVEVLSSRSAHSSTAYASLSSHSSQRVQSRLAKCTEAGTASTKHSISQGSEAALPSSEDNLLSRSGQILDIAHEHVKTAISRSGSSSDEENDELDVEPEFETLVSATRTLVDALQSLYHPTLAEYISTVNAIRTLKLYENSLKVAIKIDDFAPNSRARKHTDGSALADIQQASGQALGLRQICQREGLLDSLHAVDNELGIDEHTIDEWQAVNAVRSSTLAPDSGMSAIARSFAVCQLDASVRVAEWMYHALDTDDRSEELYHTIFTQVAYPKPASNLQHEVSTDFETLRSRQVSRGVSTNPNVHLLSPFSRQYHLTSGELPIPNTRTVALRTVLKLWFLESDGLINNSTASSDNGATVESDETIRSSGHTDYVLADVNDPSASMSDLQEDMLRCVKYAESKVCISTSTDIDLCHSTAPGKYTKAAQIALTEYQQESSTAVGDVDDLHEQAPREKPSYLKAYDLVFAGGSLVPRTLQVHQLVNSTWLQIKMVTEEPSELAFPTTRLVDTPAARTKAYKAIQDSHTALDRQSTLEDPLYRIEVG